MSAWRVAASGARGTDRVAENSRVAHVVGTHVPSARTARWTAHCHAATACVLTRAYQGDHRRHKPDSHHARGCHTSLDHPASHPVDKPFHIRATRPGPRRTTGGDFVRYVLCPTSRSLPLVP